MRTVSARSILVAAVGMSLAACTEVFGPESGPFCAYVSGSAEIEFPDSALDLAVRSELSLSTRAPLTCAMVSGITRLGASGAGIRKLDGIENLTGLRILFIRANEIEDVGPVAGLPGLTSLNVAANRISDIRALRRLEALEFLAINENGAIADIDALRGLTRLSGTLWLGSNAITSLEPLRGLTALTVINAWDNELTDLDGLGSLVGLTTIRAHGNALTDLSALATLPALRLLTLHDNPGLTDIQPLLTNPNLGPGVEVNLSGTAVSCADIDALSAKGVGVTSDCP